MTAPKPKSSPGRLEFICISAATMMLTALGIDIMLPALGALRTHFRLDANSPAAANVIVFFFMGQVAQLIFGVLSDRLGRLPILKIGFPLYIAGGFAAAFAPTLTTMCIARFISGMGASAVLTTTIAGVRDRFVGDQMARTMSFIFTIFLFTPIVAPFLGIGILSVFSWKAVFLTPPFFAVIIFVWSLLRLNESHPPEARSVLSYKSVRNSLRIVLTNKTFLRFTFVTTFLFAGLSVWVSTSERIIGEIYKTPKLFPWIFGGMGLVMSLTSLSNAKLSVRYGAKKVLRTLVLVYVAVAAALLIGSLLTNDPPPAVLFFGCIVLLMAINLAIEPNCSALALEPLGDNAGIAASMYGTIFFFVGSSIGALLGALIVNGVIALVAGFLILGILASLLVWKEPKHSE